MFDGKVKHSTSWEKDFGINVAEVVPPGLRSESGIPITWGEYLSACFPNGLPMAPTTTDPYVEYLSKLKFEDPGFNPGTSWPEPAVPDLEFKPKGPSAWIEQELKFANKALNAVTRDDRRDKEHPLINLLRIGIKWSVDLGVIVKPRMVAMMMVDLKTCRDLGYYNEDNWVDTIGYSELVELCDTKLREMGYATGIIALESMGMGELWGLLQSLTHKTI